MPYADKQDPRIKDARRRHYEANKGQYRERATARRIAARAFVTEQKNKPCADCGGTFPPCAMDFDHLGEDKTDHISVMATNGLALNRLTEEIAKCEVVCANCHRIRTFSRSRPKS